MNISIGHNRSPFELVSDQITDLYEEAKNWLDGESIETQEQANAINTLLSRIKEAVEKADEARKEETKPHNDAKAEIQERYNRLIGQTKTVTGLAVKAEAACKDALKPYLLKLHREQEEKARLAREEAECKRIEAMEAMQSREAGNLQSYEDAETRVQQARQAEQEARNAEKAKAHAKGEGRATGLRTVWRAVMTDQREAAAWVWKERNDELMAFVQDLADKAVRAGARKIHGFDVVEEKVL